MKSHTEYLTFNVPSRMDFLNITPEVERAVTESGIQEGIVLCNAMHITASVFINDDESGLHQDYKDWLQKLAPVDPSPKVYRHNRTGEACPEGIEGTMLMRTGNGTQRAELRIMGRQAKPWWSR